MAPSNSLACKGIGSTSTAPAFTAAAPNLALHSSEIARIAKRLGALTPFIRPSELSGDKVLDYPVVEHAINFFNSQWF